MASLSLGRDIVQWDQAAERYATYQHLIWKYLGLKSDQC